MFIHGKQLIESLEIGISQFSLFIHGVEGSSNDKPAYFTCASTDFIQLCIAQITSRGVVIDVAITTC